MFRHVLRRGLQLTGVVATGGTTAGYAVYRYERSQVPAGSELIRCSAETTETPPAVLRKLSTDNLMGGFDAYYLASTWFYDKPLDAAAIKATLAQAVTKMPALAGRRSSEGVSLCNEGARFSVCEGRAGSAYDHIGKDAHLEPPRGDFADIPSCCTGGEQPLFTVRVTNFADGTSAIGIASPHSLMDGKSYFEVVSAIATAHTEHGGAFDAPAARRGRGAAAASPLVPTPNFDAAPVWEQVCARGGKSSLDARAVALPTLPVPFWLLEQTTPLWALGMKRLDNLLPRAKVHLTRAELNQLKADVNGALLQASKSGGKGSSSGVGRPVSTNEALSAAFLHALSSSTPGGPFTPGATGIVRMVVNVQGKGAFADVGRETAGNFSWMVDAATPAPPETMSMAAAANFIVALGAKWRDAASSTAAVDDFALFFRCQDLKGYLWEQTDDIANTLFLNNQAKLPMAQIRFGTHATLIGFHPWHSHQHVQMVAAPPDAPPSKSGRGRAQDGGIDVYLPRDYSPLLGTAAFKERLLHGWQQ